MANREAGIVPVVARQHIARRPIAGIGATGELRLEFPLADRAADHGGCGRSLAGFLEFRRAVADELAHNLAGGFFIGQRIGRADKRVHRLIARRQPPLLAIDQHGADLAVRRLLQHCVIGPVQFGVDRHRLAIRADQLLDRAAGFPAIYRQGRRRQREQSGHAQQPYRGQSCFHLILLRSHTKTDGLSG
ncbi:hypothetical protein D3C85_1179130 [compost metagenome]